MKVLRWLPLGVLGAWVLLSLAAGLFALEPYQVRLDRILALPSAESWLGYDELGRSVAHRLLLSLRSSLYIALLVVSLSLLIGVPVGICAARLGGWFDRLVLFCIDCFLAFPGLLLAIAVTGFLGPGLFNTVLALCFAGWVSFARLARVQTLALARAGHVEAAQALGTPPLRVAWHHILPLLAATLSVQLTFELAGVIIAESTLSFIGLGVQPPTPSLGNMILEGARYMLVAPHLVLAPGLLICVLVLCVNLLGDQLRDRADVRFPGSSRGLRGYFS